MTYLIDLFCVVVFVTKIIRVRMCNTNNALILWIKDFTGKVKSRKPFNYINLSGILLKSKSFGDFMNK